METAANQPAKTEQIIRRYDGLFPESVDALIKQIQATHDPDGRKIDIKPILNVVETILQQVSPGIDGGGDASEDKAALGVVADILEGLANTINKISCELSNKCSDDTDAHATTLRILNRLSSYTWDAKIVTSMASFAVNYGEFWLLAKLFATNPLAKSVAVLKQLPDIIEHSNALKSRYDAINNLIKAMLDVTKCIVEFKGSVPTQYGTDETSLAASVYWTIRSTVACASAITSLLGKTYQTFGSMEVTWELSSLAQKLRNIHGLLQKELSNCYQDNDEKTYAKYFQMLINTFGIPHLDNLRILRALIYIKDDLPPLTLTHKDSTKTRVNVEVLRGKTFLLLISDLHLSEEEVFVLTFFYQEAQSRQDCDYEIVWLPVVDRSMQWNETYEQKFRQLQSIMPWYTLHHPSLLEPAVTKYIKELWHFEKKLMLVVLDPAGKVACPNALHMVWIWGNLAYPFTLLKEESLWKEETWRLELLVDGIDQAILDWMVEGKFICLYGGEDIEWIRRFTEAARKVAGAAGISLEMVYVGKSSNKERVQKNNDIIIKEQVSHCWNDPAYVRYFWTRVESMLCSKTQHGKTVQNDKIMQEVQTILTFDGSDQGWALISRGSAEMARARGDTMFKSLTDYPTWEKDAKEKGFVPALNDHLQSLHSVKHPQTQQPRVRKSVLRRIFDCSLFLCNS